jgi:hypothetical protein
MRAANLIRCAVLGVSLFAGAAQAQEFSTSPLNPTALPASGIVTGAYPTGGAETSYYFAVNLSAGELATQISFLGRPNRDKKLEFDLLDARGKAVGSHYILGTLDANAEGTRVIPVDASGRYTVRVRTTGPETTTFKVEIGGTAFPSRKANVTAASPYSSSYLAPTALPADGVISGKFPGGEDKLTYYYFVADLKAGNMLSQLSVAGRANTPKWLQLELLDKRGRSAASYYVMAGLEAKRDATRALPVDATGRYILRVGVKGTEGTTFKVELGGDALVATR